MPTARSLFLALVLCLLAVNAGAQGAASASPEQVVKEFYTWYLKHRGGPSEVPAKWVDPHLLSELALAKQRSNDDNDFLDFDPFLCNQAGFSRFEVRKVERQGDKAVASLQLWEGRGGDYAIPSLLRVTLNRQDGRWLIGNVASGDDPTEILTILDKINAPFRPEAPPLEAEELAYSADGKWLAAGTRNGRVVLLEKGARPRVLRLEKPRRVAALGFLPGGRLWIQDARRLRLLDLSSEQIRDIPLSIGAEVLVSPDGRWAAACGQKPGTEHATTQGLSLLDLTQARAIAWLPFGKGERPHDMSFSQDGRWLAASEKGSIVVWDLATRERVARMAGVDFRFLRFLPDGNLLSLDSAGCLVEWEVASGKSLRVGYAGVFDPTGWDVSADGSQVLMAAADGTSRVWLDRTARNPQAELKGNALAFLPNGEVLVQRDMAYFLWTPNGERPLGDIGALPVPSPDGKALAWPNPAPAATDGTDHVKLLPVP